jgi:hypothetical protein
MNNQNTVQNKVISLGTEEFDQWDLANIKSLPDFNWLVYAYEYSAYEGSGLAVWKRGEDYFYHELGHCSCNGPLDMISRSDKMNMTLDMVLRILESNYPSMLQKTVHNYIQSLTAQNIT